MTEGLETVAIASPGGELEATFVPAAGMLCCSLRHRGEELLAQGAGVTAYYERGSTMGIPLLYPWANRLAGFSYGRDPVVELPPDSPRIKLDPNGLPIHGVLHRGVPWELTHEGQVSLCGRARWSGETLLGLFPFPHEVEVRASLDAGALTIATTVRAGTQGAVPVSFGYHPYLTIPATGRSGWLVELPLTSRLCLDRLMIPTGESEPVHYPPFELADSDWDDGFDGLARPARFAVSAAGRRLELDFEHGYSFGQVFSPRGGDFICFEPMTAPTNALRSGLGLGSVPAGGSFTASFRVRVEGP